MLLVGSYIAFQFLDGQPIWVMVLVMLFVIAPGFIYYGYFLSSQFCRHCGEPIFTLPDHYPVMRFVAFAFPFHVPKRCPTCGKAAKWFFT